LIFPHFERSPYLQKVFDFATGFILENGVNQEGCERSEAGMRHP